MTQGWWNMPKPKPVNRETLALFIRFVRLNPTIADDDPVMLRAFDAHRNADLSHLKKVAS